MRKGVFGVLGWFIPAKDIFSPLAVICVCKIPKFLPLHQNRFIKLRRHPFFSESHPFSDRFLERTQKIFTGRLAILCCLPIIS